MDEAQFWQIIQQSYDACDGDIEEQADALRLILQAMTPAEIQQFSHQFSRRFFEAYSYDLWGAIALIEGGCGDDSFMDFRSWLISRGESTFRQVLADPETLVAEPARLDQTDLFFEEFGSVADTVYQAKTGKLLAPEFDTPMPEPSGAEFDLEDESSTAERWPQIWARYGGD